MSTSRQFSQFHTDLVETLERQTGLTMGEYTALIMAGQNPSFRSDVARFADKLIKRREKGKKIRQRDYDALLDMVIDYLAFQHLSGKDRVTYARQVLQKIVPNLSATDLTATGPGEVHSIELDSDTVEEIREIIRKELHIPEGQ